MNCGHLNNSEKLSKFVELVVLEWYGRSMTFWDRGDLLFKPVPDFFWNFGYQFLRWWSCLKGKSSGHIVRNACALKFSVHWLLVFSSKIVYVIMKGPNKGSNLKIMGWQCHPFKIGDYKTLVIYPKLRSDIQIIQQIAAVSIVTKYSYGIKLVLPTPRPIRRVHRAHTGKDWYCC